VDICLIWAQARNGAISKHGRLPWYGPQHMHRLIEATSGHPLIMGRKTWESLFGSVLPGRQSIVLSRQQLMLTGAAHCSSLSDALTLASVLHTGRAYVIGGAQLLRQAIAVADRLLVTQVDIEVDEADAFAPTIDLARFRLTERIARNHVAGPALVHEEYVRRGYLD
jgi:dihydrofolate reductase